MAMMDYPKESVESTNYSISVELSILRETIDQLRGQISSLEDSLEPILVGKFDTLPPEAANSIDPSHNASPVQVSLNDARKSIELLTDRLVNLRDRLDLV